MPARGDVMGKADREELQLTLWNGMLVAGANMSLQRSYDCTKGHTKLVLSSSHK